MIKKYKKFIEAISGTELVGRHMGPNYPTNELPTTLKQKDTNVIYSELFGRIVTYDEYQDLYFNYLKKGGKPLNGFTKDNLEKVLDIVKESRDYDSYTATESDKIIEETFKEVLVDFLTDYSMMITFSPGYDIPKFHGWMSVYTWNSIKSKLDIGNSEWPKLMKINILNEHWNPELGKKGQDEIYIDEDSESKFIECIKTIESILKYELDNFISIEYPNKFESTWWQITILVKYND